MEYGPDVALVVVDVQNDFADARGSLYVGGGEEIVPLVNDEIDRAAAAGSPIFFTQDWHPASTPHFETDGGIWPVHCVAGTWGAEFHPGLHVTGRVVRKGTGGEDGYSGFTVRDPQTGTEDPTGLEDMLRDRGIGRVVVVGLATDYCVKATALDAIARGFDTIVRTEQVRGVNLSEGDDRKALDEIEAAGGVLE